jgi:DNA excision repair protein ERCC-2
MEFDLDQRQATLSVGEFAGFTLGPHDSGSGQQGIWRAQLGTQWHQELRQRVSSERNDAQFEVTIAGRVFHQGWTLSLSGRIDQILPEKDHTTLREIKTVMRPLPMDEAQLRREYPEYFAQAATYLKLQRLADPRQSYHAELFFVEAGSGLAQSVPLTLADEASHRGQLVRVAEFLSLRLQARERLRGLRFRPAFAEPRPGQETTLTDLTAAFERHPAVLFEAPTGFGKTGVLLEFALGQLRSGHFDRALYLTSKSTGQIQVVHQLSAMTTAAPPDPPLKKCNLMGYISRDTMEEPLEEIRTEPRPTCNPLGYNSVADAGPSVAAWHVRNKSEHCVNHTFHCVRDNCTYLDGMEERWPQSGLARFYRFENQARDLETLRAAGRAARICPYEITRASLAFNDVWIGDYNYVFAPANRSLFYFQPGFDPARTLLIIDEAHNLPSRVADAFSHHVHANEVRGLLAELDHLQAPTNLVRAWESYVQLISALLPVESLDPALEADLADTLGTIANLLANQPLDYAALGPDFSAQLWRVQELLDWLERDELRKLLWCPREGELSLTCLDAAGAIGETLRTFGGVVLASATLSPTKEFIQNIGMDAADSIEKAPTLVPAATPWRDGAYDVAVDYRVDTTFQHRSRHFATTAATIAAMQAAAKGPVAVFFPSYAYAEAILKAVDSGPNVLRVALQPRLHQLTAQSAWVEESLVLADALFLVLGSSFAESIDLLGGRVSHAMVVGPALPEVNAVQRARMAEFDAQGRETAFRRVYQIPGLQKVNQALGRLVRAPGQRAKILLHCKRFGEARYANLLAHDYQFGVNITSEAELKDWVGEKN